MQQTNSAFDGDIDRVSVAESLTERSAISTPGRSNKGRNERKYSNHSSKEQQKRDEEPKQTSSSDEDSYYSLQRFRERRRGERDDDSSLSRSVKRFYKRQDELIDVYERIHNQNSEHGEALIQAEEEKQKRVQKISNILTKVSLGVNICLFILKIVGAALSKSLSVISSVIDSAVDLATSVILFWAWHMIKKRDKYRYPQGRTRLEPVAIIILSVIMCAASVLVIYESINTIANNAMFFTEHNTTKTLTEIEMSALPIAVMVITIVSKSILFFLCCRVKTPTMSALSSDHRNDVLSNIVALSCGLVGSFAYRRQIDPRAIFVDPIGAILISCYIIFSWIRQANDQIKRLSGHTADPKFLSQITWLTYHHSPMIKKIDTVRAFYFGTSYLVEVDIVLPENMPLREAHDIGEELQKKIEHLPEVERAFVHIDYEFDHNPSTEHKVV